jgi:putative methyltransferase (TIGR04325 family)
MAKPWVGRRMRMMQVRVAAAALNGLGRYRKGVALLAALRGIGPTRGFLNSVLGFRRKFESYHAAEAVALRYDSRGHTHPEDIDFHTSIAGVVRESDYPMLYFMARNAARYQRVFDLGGNVGNLFYSYAPWLELSQELRWTVLDLPEKKEYCEALAAKRGESRVKFATGLQDASGVDVFIASGSMHYFPQRLDKLLGGLAELPRQVFVNRSPFSRGEDVITIQDNGSYLVPCVAYGKAGLIEGMNALGYELRAEWPVHERRLRVPMYEDVMEPYYAGLFFERS